MASPAPASGARENLKTALDSTMSLEKRSFSNPTRRDKCGSCDEFVARFTWRGALRVALILIHETEAIHRQGRFVRITDRRLAYSASIRAGGRGTCAKSLIVRGFRRFVTISSPSPALGPSIGRLPRGGCRAPWSRRTFCHGSPRRSSPPHLRRISVSGTAMFPCPAAPDDCGAAAHFLAAAFRSHVGRRVPGGSAFAFRLAGSPTRSLCLGITPASGSVSRCPPARTRHRNMDAALAKPESPAIPIAGHRCMAARSGR